MGRFHNYQPQLLNCLAGEPANQSTTYVQKTPDRKIRVPFFGLPWHHFLCGSFGSVKRLTADLQNSRCLQTFGIFSCKPSKTGKSLVGSFWSAEIPVFIFTINIVRLAETLQRNGCQGNRAYVQRLFSDLRSKVQEDRHKSFLPSSCCSVQHAFCVGICTWREWRDYMFRQKF